MSQVQQLLCEPTNLNNEIEILPGEDVRRDEVALLARIFERNGRVESVGTATPPGYVYVPAHPASAFPDGLCGIDGPIVQVAAHPGDGPDFFYATYLQMATNSRYDNTYHEILLTDGERGVDGWSPEQTRQIRIAEAEAGAEIVGSHLHFLGYPDSELASLADNQRRQLVGQLAELIGNIRPALLVVHPPKHDHPDHAASFGLTLAALELHAQSGRRTPTLLVHDVEFGLQQASLPIRYPIDDPDTQAYPLHTPGLLVDISATHQTAQRALHEHHTQMVDPLLDQPKVYAELIDTLARVRGLQLKLDSASPMARGQGFSHVVIPGVTSEQNSLPWRLPARSVFIMKRSMYLRSADHSRSHRGAHLLDGVSL